MCCTAIPFSLRSIRFRRFVLCASVGQSNINSTINEHQTTHDIPVIQFHDYSPCSSPLRYVLLLFCVYICNVYSIYDGFLRLCPSTECTEHTTYIVHHIHRITAYGILTLTSHQSPFARLPNDVDGNGCTKVQNDRKYLKCHPSSTLVVESINSVIARTHTYSYRV